MTMLARMIDAAEIALVAAVLDVEPAVTGVILAVEEFSLVPAWDTMVVVIMRGAMDALEVDEITIAAFAATHPPVGQYEIVIDADMRAAVDKSRTEMLLAS